MKKLIVAGSFITGVLCSITFLMLFGRDKQPLATVQTTGNPKWQIPALPETMDFAGDTVPLNRWEVREYLEREILYNYYQPGHILYILRLSQKYFPLIEQQLKINNIPDDFKYLCVTESNLQNLVSRAGATGFWQFMKTTAPAYNLEVKDEVDERYHVIKSTRAACAYLRSAYEKFGSWTAAAASYNCGMAGYAQRAAYQRTNNYYRLLLPEETQRYVFRILTFKYLIENADSLGFSLPPSSSALKTKTVLVSQDIPDLAAFAREHGTEYKLLKFLNPWLRERSLPVKRGKVYELIIPEP